MWLENWVRIWLREQLAQWAETAEVFSLANSQKVEQIYGQLPNGAIKQLTNLFGTYQMPHEDVSQERCRYAETDRQADRERETHRQGERERERFVINMRSQLRFMAQLKTTKLKSKCLENATETETKNSEQQSRWSMRLHSLF